MKRTIMALILYIVLAFGLCACAKADPVITEPQTEPTQVAQTEEQGRSLLISAIVDSEAGVTKFSPEDLNGCQSELMYNDLTSVQIQLGGIMKPLEEAIRNQDVTVAQLTAWARMDAENGLCEETVVSKNGLAEFVYLYGDFDLHIIHDIYETPDGQQHLISVFNLFPPNSGTGKGLFFTNEDGSLMDLEDWGITTEVTEVTPTGITFNCIQSGGQQIGELKTNLYMLDSKTEERAVTNGVNEVVIERDATTTITLDWSETCGELPSGTYILNFEVRDNYDESQVHPLMRNFHDRQYYGFEFDIP